MEQLGELISCLEKEFPVLDSCGVHLSFITSHHSIIQFLFYQTKAAKEKGVKKLIIDVSANRGG